METRPDTITTLRPGLRRIIAPNPSAFTYWGTNSYLLGQGEVALIDPGPDDPAHLAAILSALEPGERISHILVTHSHLDHSPLSARAARETGAPILAFGTSEDGRSAVMQQIAETGLADGGEGFDADFRPDVRLPDGTRVSGGDWEVTALWTPGHFGNHMCFEFEDEGGFAAFCGDLVMGWSTSIVSPPDGDLTDFMASCTRMKGRGHVRLYPGHGLPIEDPSARLSWLLAHRRARETAILAALADGPAGTAALTARIYTDIQPGLLPAAERNVLAHLIDLVGQNRVEALPDLRAGATFRLR